MKHVRGILIVSCFFLLTERANGQMEVELGVKGGVNFSNINSVSSVVSVYGEQTGYHAGAYAMFKFGKAAIQPEVLYSSEGQQYKYVQPGFPQLKSTFNYINVPILLKVYVTDWLNLQAGPQFGFLLNSTGYTYATSGVSPSPVITSQPLGDFVQTFNASIAIGAGIDLPFGLNFSLRYNGGVRDINTRTGQYSPVSSAFGTSIAKTEVFQISVGYRLFKIGG